MDIKNKDLKYYLNLPWTYTIETSEDENKNKIYIISVNELPNIQTDAETIDKAMQLVQEAMIGAFKLYKKHGEEIPEPIDESKFKGDISYRTTSKRHFMVAKEANKRKLSLSKIIDECIDKTLGPTN